MTDYRKILKQYWGYDNFRGIQEDIIRSIGEGRDTLGLMPTGGGKSITFQVPALAQEGLCLVITPLIALMKDQVRNLRERGIKATAIYSGMTREEIVIALENCIFGNYKFLYVSPERLDTEIFQIKLRSMHVSLITVDESHCISQWGYDFRPAYLKIADIRQLLPGVPVIALTATATPEVVSDIQQRLQFRQENVFRMSFERKNLAYVVRHTEDKESEYPQSAFHGRDIDRDIRLFAYAFCPCRENVFSRIGKRGEKAPCRRCSTMRLVISRWYAHGSFYAVAISRRP